MRHSSQAKKLLKKQPPIKGPKILQESWDAHKTVRQNYEALGLLASLNPTASGGMEPSSVSPSREDHAVSGPSRPEASGSREELGNVPAVQIPKGYGRIIRDESGNILDVEFGEEEGEGAAEAENIEEVANPSAEEQLAGWVELGSKGDVVVSHVVEVLEEISKTGGGKKPRFTSTGELKALRVLVQKHRGNMEAMARDRKLNVDQRTAGELRRAVQKAGGLESLMHGG